jgi:poly-gamma-glutamate capsule biosynthesis protein CapA/YwtB (metallophosphatase superfamily)
MIKLFLCGDVMTARGIDQILRSPSPPHIHEPGCHSALDYVRLAEEVNGPIPRAVEPAYIWGDALLELERARPDARIINLETAVTSSEDWAPKGINYRMSPANVGCLTAAGVDCCALANNHVLDWGVAGLAETLRTLQTAGIRTAGAGADSPAAEAPAVVPLRDGIRLLVFSVGSPTSGIPESWAASRRRPGICYLPDLSRAVIESIARRIRAVKRSRDIAVVSIHWGSNWGYEITAEQTRFAHALIDDAGVDLVHGHSSHHVKAIEVHRGRLVLYGCGDLINDYEGIGGREVYRGDLGAMFFPVLDADNGRLLELDLVATTMKRFRLRLAGDADVDWLAAMLARESRRYGTLARRSGGCRLQLTWDGAPASAGV